MRRTSLSTALRRLALALVLVPALAIGHLALAADDRAPGTASKAAALDHIARRVLLPAYTGLAARSRDLAVAAEALTATPSTGTLHAAQQAWRETLLAWRRSQPFMHGPVADLGVAGRIQFWPSRRQSLDRVLRAARPFDDTYVQELGANAVGLSALEIMLFDRRQDDAARVTALSGPQGERQRRYLLALTRELAKQTRAVEAGWQGQAGYAVRFAGGGQSSLNLLVNDLLAAVESGAQSRLRIVIDRHGEPQFEGDLVEGAASGTSQQALLALLAAARDVFLGGSGAGVDDYLRGLKPATARRVEQQFDRAIAAVRAIDLPLEQAIASRPAAVARAADQCQALEIALKVEAASTLGVTLTFKSTDGD